MWGKCARQIWPTSCSAAPGDRAARRGAAGHSEARRGHGHQGGDHAGGAGKAPAAYVTLEMPSVSVLDERDTDVIETGAAELRALLPPEGPVLVLGIGNRRVTADALGPRTAQKILVTMGPQHTLPVRGIRPVAALAPGVSGGHRADPAAAGGGHGRRSAARSP